MPIDEWSEEPRYRQLAAILRDRMATDAIPAGGKLPTEVELMDEFGLGRSTVRAAIQVLRDEGLVVARPARGTFRVPTPKQ
ncbi:winged helix-turn-helix domain-containing protein [Jiangella muralis]|uniref:winged helix-turn-helix domain-containing protein n=1 Tax=Jiangella muralis TaxID=702383 RepID=UPI0012FA0AA2|nr:winged helix-turn-helix domain-containing protein [Jiangella muralis]